MQQKIQEDSSSSSSSLLHEALQYMQQSRQEENFKRTCIYNCIPWKDDDDDIEDQDKEEEDHDDDDADDSYYATKQQQSSPSPTMMNTMNTLIMNIFYIDPFIGMIQSSASSQAQGNNEFFQKQMHVGLCKIYTIIQKELIPRYKQTYVHNTWTLGDDGFYQGIGLQQYKNNNNKKKKIENILHLTCQIFYGINPYPDEWFSLAFAFQISNDLFHLYGIHVAIECWDKQDGQILLLLESTSSTSSSNIDAITTTSTNGNDHSSWIDTMESNHRMKRRVYILQGQVHVVVISPNQKNDSSSICSTATSTRTTKTVTRYESLYLLTEQYLYKQSFIIPENTYQQRLYPFLQLFQQDMPPSMSLSQKKKKLQYPWLHTGAMIVPQILAQMIHVRPNLIACAIHTFCQYAPEKLLGIIHHHSHHDTHDYITTTHENINSSSSSWKMMIPFENLVLTKFTTSKTLYTMLVTCCGRLYPPINKLLPLSYKTIESTRITRQYISKNKSSHEYPYFRYAYECGVRISLGLEWYLESTISPSTYTLLLRQQQQKDPITVQQRIQHHAKIHKSIGGNEKWIQQAWNVGPNYCKKEDDITNLIQCPIYDVEIQYGGICPVTYPFQSVFIQIQQILKQIHENLEDEEEEEFDDEDRRMMFPLVPLMDELDSDLWMDDIDTQLLHVQSFHKNDHHAVNLFKDDFEKSSDVPLHHDNCKRNVDDNISLDPLKDDTNKKDTRNNNDTPPRETVTYDEIQTGMKEDDELCIDSQVFLSIMNQVLRISSNKEDQEEEEGESLTPVDKTLMHYFSEEDMNDFDEYDD